MPLPACRLAADRLIETVATLTRRLLVQLPRPADGAPSGIPSDQLPATMGAKDREATAAARGRGREADRHTTRPHLEATLIVYRALFIFLASALRPPLLQKNKQLLFALLRLFPTAGCRELVQRMDIAHQAALQRQEEGTEQEAPTDPTEASRLYHTETTRLGEGSPAADVTGASAPAESKAAGSHEKLHAAGNSMHTVELLSQLRPLLLPQMTLLLDLVILCEAALEQNPTECNEDEVHLLLH